jgi:hypothetical protein
MKAGQKLNSLLLAVVLAGMAAPEARAQLLLGSITGTATDASGAGVPDVKVTARNLGTNLKQEAVTQTSGMYQISDLPIGLYTLTFSKEGFETEVHTQVQVQGNRTSTVNVAMKVGTVATTVEVTATPLMNQVDTTNGYVLDQLTIENTPLGTGSFTQLAILSPGVSADFLGGSGSNAGLGNQSIFANGQRDTSNSFTLNGIDSNNLFNGKSSSQVGSNRFVLNTNENFLSGGEIQTSTSVYDAIGQGLPTPPPEAIQELRVNTSMYDVSQGAHSGAHIAVMTKSGTNEFHGSGYGHYQTSDWNAAPFFRNSDPTVPADQKVPFLDRKTIGFTLGGPILKDKLFFFGSYQGIRADDQLAATSQVTVPQHLTDDRSAAALAQVANTDFSSDGTFTAAQISPQALALMQAKTKNGRYFIPTPTVTDPNQAASFGYNALVVGPNAQFLADQFIGNLDYIISSKDRIAGKYFYQNDPNKSPFTGSGGAPAGLLGFPQTLEAGAHSFSLENTTILGPNLTWTQRVGFTRQRAYSTTSQAYTPQQFGINLFGYTRFPGITITTADPNIGNSLPFGPASNFANAGVFQNQFQGGTDLGWVVGRHTIAVGFNWNYTQLNIINRNTDVASIGFNDFSQFLQGLVQPGVGNSTLFTGSANRYYRANTTGAFINDNFKVKSNLVVTLGLRYDYDGPLSEKHGLLSNFDPAKYQYDSSTDTITSSGLVIAGNNKLFHTPGTNNSTINANQWGFAPRIGVAWTPGFIKNVVLRAGYGFYYDRGELFSYLSPSAGSGYNGPFGVTLEPPFVVPFPAPKGATLDNPFGTTPPPPPPGSVASFAALLPNVAQTSGGSLPFLFGGYDPRNGLPFTQNWTADVQWQPLNSMVFDLAYVGNHGKNQVLPIPFNQPGIATASHPINGQIYSYGFDVTSKENLSTWDGGNTDVRVPYIGYSPNSVFYRAIGISNYDALQFQLRKRFSHGLQFTVSYTWSHSLDEQSGLGLFYNGNDPLHPQGGYGNSDFDRTHVFSTSYLYQLPKLVARERSFLGYLANGWGISGVITAQSGQPYNVYDYSGALASIYYSFNDYITNPTLPLAPGYTVGKAQLQGTTGVNAGKPFLDKAAFSYPTLQPGQDGVPPCDVNADGTQLCDTYETTFGNGGRNIFRGPFQTRFDTSIFKEVSITERVKFRYSADFFNLFNHPSFDTPNNDLSFYGYTSSGPPRIFNPPRGSLGKIQHTIGSPRFLQMSLRLTF